MRVNEPEYYAAFTSEAAATPVVHGILTNLQNEDLNVTRLVALDTRPGHIVDAITPYQAVGLFHEEFRTLEDWDEYEADHPHPFVDFKEIASSYHTSAGGYRYLLRERSWAGHEATIYQALAFFSLPSGTLQIELGAHLNFKDTYTPEFLAVVDSLQLFNP